MKRPLRRALSVRSLYPSMFTAIALFGCGGDSNEDRGEWAGTCVRDDALIAHAMSCTRDDDCACGTSCTLGACERQCTWNADCDEGKVCDSFGRCLAPERANAPIPIGSEDRGAVPAGQGSLYLDKTSLEASDTSQPQTFRVAARTATLQALRVAASAGLEVECGDGNFAAECRFGPLQITDAPRAVRVRGSGQPSLDPARGSVLVYADATRKEIGVALAPAGEPRPSTRHGVYEGSAWLVGTGMTSRTVIDTLPPELARLKMRLRAQVFPLKDGKYTIALFDERNTVVAAGAVGTLSVSTGSESWELDLPGRRYLVDETTSVTGVELDVHARGRMREATFRDGVLQGDLVSTFEGVTTTNYAPFARWRISLSRVADLPQGLSEPQVAPVPAPNVAQRAAAALDDEQFADEEIRGLALVPASDLAVAALCTERGHDAVTTLLPGVDRRGDLLCDGGSPQRAFAPTSGTLIDRGAYLDDCLRALDPQRPEDRQLADATQPGQCANHRRAVAAIALSLRSDRARALQGSTEVDFAASTLAARLLQQWLAIQSVAGADPTRIATLGPLLPGGPDVDRLRYYSQYGNAFKALRSSIGGWDLLLHPRVGAAVAAMVPAALHTPDYRRRLFQGSTDFVGGEQTLGLPVNMLATLTSQLEGVNGLVDGLRNMRIAQHDAKVYAAEVARFMPRNVVLFAMAQGLRDAARSESVPGWEDAWINARAKYGVALARIADDLRALESEQNPLGIEEGDLPLYRLGDQQGIGRRFSAVSDSLLGREDLLDPAIVPVLVSRAADAEQLARASFTQVLERDYETELQQAASDRNIESFKRYYGEQVTSLCAFGYENSLTVFDELDTIDAETCFIKPECMPTPEVAEARSSKADLAHQMCLFSKFRSKVGDALSMGDRSIDEQLDALVDTFRADAPLPELPTTLLEALRELKAQKGNGGQQPSSNLPDDVDQQGLRDMRALCDSARDATEALRPTVAPTSCTSTDDCPVGLVCDLSEDKLACVPPQQLPETCYMGGLGQALLAVQAAAIELEIAKREFDEHQERYAIAMQSCINMQTTSDAIEKATDKFRSTMTAMGAVKLAADIVEKTANVSRELMEKQDLFSVFSTPARVALGVVEVAAFSVSAGMQYGMDIVERNHEAAVAEMERNLDIDNCKNEASAELVGQRAAALQIQAAEKNIFIELDKFDYMQRSVGWAIDEGLASIASERTRAVLPANVDFWLDDNVDLFQQRLRRARRALYLAVLGTEYEFQITSAERANVLAAQSSAELEAIQSRLRESVRRGAPAGGGNPTELLSVLSLRQNILQIASRENMPEGWQQLDETERFRRVLVSPEYAAYDASGDYAGQEIPFSLLPREQTGLANAASVPLFSGLSCAERLWAVNASVHGSEAMTGTDTSLATLQIRKRNTFQSQWCSGGSPEQPLQIASTRPQQNLFIDPMSSASWADDSVLQSLTNTGEASAFSWATVQARLNVSRRELETNEYLDGRSTSLAGRGVFGDYTLFVPKTALSLNGSPGLALDKVDDILIRFDYVAAERQ